MANTSDNAVTAGRPRTSGGGIVLAGDRASSRTIARRHSRNVRLLKYGLPLGALAISGIYGASVMKTIGWGSGIPELTMPQILPENLTMDNPHYEGFNKDGGRYWVKALTAQQDLKNLSLIRLNAITGELTDAQKKTTQLTATRGTFDNKANQLELFDSIDVAGDAGMKAHLTRASINTKESIITSDQPVLVMMSAGTINANQMTVRQKTKEYIFVNNVQTFLKARTQAETAAAPRDKVQQVFGSSDDPVNITSNRLDINDASRMALFTGQVRAVQGAASLTSPELEVSYEGSATPAADAAESGGKVKRIVAKSPVVLKQATGETVTSQGADFDAIGQKAVLDGDVVMLQPPDKRAVGDRAEIDQAANTVLLTGAVVMTQGSNELKGRRLFFDRASSKMQLTAQGGGGRVTARFQQAAAGPGQPAAAPKADEGGQGIAMGATFKTEPGAPVNVESDRLDVDDGAKQAVFTGNVKAVQGAFVIRSAELTATYLGSAGLSGPSDAAASAGGAAKLTRVQARKKVEVTSREGQNAKGDWADFDIKSNTATLGGDVILTQGKNVVRGTRLDIDMTTGESVIKTEPGSADNGAMITSSDGTGAGQIIKSGRPSAVFYPGDMKAPEAGKPAAKNTSKSPAKDANTDQDGWQMRTAP